MKQTDLQNDSNASVRVPVVANVDVLVVGSGSAAVSAALEAKTKGATVFALSDRSYFGEEAAGTLELWQDNGKETDPLFDAMFPQGSVAPSRPGFIKRVLEQALLEENIPFWFWTRPVALLHDDHGLAGAVVAFRTSLYAIRCRSIVDASSHGLVSQLAAQSFPGHRPAAKETSLVTLVHELPETWAGSSKKLEPFFDLEDRKGNKMNIQSFRLGLACDETSDDSVLTLSGTEHRLRSQLLDSKFQGSADVISLPSRKVLATEDKWTDNPLAALEKWDISSTGVVPCNYTLPLTAQGIAHLQTTIGQLTLGRLAGSMAADWAKSRPATTSSELRVQTGAKESAVSLAEGEGFHFAAPFLRDTTVEWLDLNFTEFPDLGQCDVAVAGGGTGGASAGISAARQGAKTVVLEMLHGLGGIGTLGLIASYWFGNRVGFTAEITEELQKMDPRPKGKEHTWNPELKMSWYHRSQLEAGGQAWLRSFAFGVIQKGERVTALLVSTPYGMGILRTDAVIDATGNADIAAAAGAPCQVLGASHVGVQGTGLSPRQPGIQERNSDHNFIDDCDVLGVTHAFVNARAKFAAEFDVAPIVNSRERRQIIGEIELSPLDFLAERTFPDTITTSASNFDTHGFTVHPVFMVLPPGKKCLSAHVPFRCLLPQNVEGVLVTGLGISAHRDAIPVVRMQADVQNQGYAAGLAAAMSVAEKKSFRALDLRRLQQHLVDKNILAPEIVRQVDSFPIAEMALREAVVDGPEKVMNVAIYFAHPEAVRPLLLEQMAKEIDPARRLGYALVLGLMGEAKAAPWLADAVIQSDWDKGWNFRGMGQFGMSMSPLDAQIIALARTDSPLAKKPILEKIRSLKITSEFSHCRAVAIAAGMLADADVSKALADLLAQPGFQGHAHLSTSDVVSKANDDLTETDARTLSLRELHLARGLYLGGDINDTGKKILQTYAADLRGHYVRHAQALLKVTDRKALARTSA